VAVAEEQVATVAHHLQSRARNLGCEPSNMPRVGEMIVQRVDHEHRHSEFCSADKELSDQRRPEIPKLSLRLKGKAVIRSLIGMFRFRICPEEILVLWGERDPFWGQPGRVLDHPVKECNCRAVDEVIPQARWKTNHGETGVRGGASGHNRTSAETC